MEGSFWWKDKLNLLDVYKSMAKCNLGDGKSALFWTDLWFDECFHLKFPHLVSFAFCCSQVGAMYRRFWSCPFAEECWTFCLPSE